MKKSVFLFSCAFIVLIAGYKTGSEAVNDARNINNETRDQTREYYLRVLFRGPSSNGPKIKKLNPEKAKEILQWTE